MDIPFLTQEWLIAIRQKLIRFFAAERCPDVENAVDETLFRLVKAIAKGTVINVKPETYVYAIAFRVAKEKKRESRNRQETPFDETTPDPPIPDDPQTEARQLCLEHCLQNLSQFERALIIQYYAGMKPGDDLRNRKIMADSLRMPVKKLTKTAMRIRRKLESCIAGCLE
ncbi:MAG: hypothetical protein AB1757_07110 [Acidobacteriota bacterium]